MNDKHFLSLEEMYYLANEAANRIRNLIGHTVTIKVYGVPRGGISAALALAAVNQNIKLANKPEQADAIVDDIVDSGTTKERYQLRFPNKDFIALIDKKLNPDLYKDKWVVFPWEVSEVGSFEDNVTRLLQFIGEDPERGGLKETPTRVTKAWQHWASGYKLDAKDILKTFEDGGESYDQMVTVKDIPFYSHCEHHLAPFFGTATISYIPVNKIVGLSKLSRLVGMFAHRLQVQERMTDQIADALFENLSPRGVGVVLKARHLCMESRGICQQGHHTITTALRGVIADGEARSEFLQLV